MTDVFVVGAATTRHGDSGRSTADLAYHAAIGAMADAGIGDRDIPSAFVGSGGFSVGAGMVVVFIMAWGGVAIANGSSVTDDAGVALMVKLAMTSAAMLSRSGA